MNPDNTNTDDDQDQKERSGQSAAANVIRSQIDTLYERDDSRLDVPERTAEPIQHIATASPVQQSQANPYQRTHSEHPLPEAEQWKQYHTAWQNYYQKYYESYYTAAVAATVPETSDAKTTHQAQKTDDYFAGQPADEPNDTTEVLSKDQALLELREKLLGKVTDSAKKIRKSRHFIPIASALGVVLVFVFLQYNQIFIANVKAYVSPGSVDPQNIVVNPTTDITVSDESRLIIPKINVDVPVYYDIGTDYNSQMAAMAKGVAHFPVAGASSHPGQIGNTVLAGHSSSDLFMGGDYKFIFVQLEKMVPGDTIYANYKGKRYTYVVTKTATVEPTDVNALIYPTSKPVMTLITCTPIGTALHRFLVTAEQVSPDPSTATAAPSTNTGNATTVIPGTKGSVISNLLGGN